MSGPPSREIPVRSRSPPPSTSTSSYDVSTLDNSGKLINISVEGPIYHNITPRERDTRRRKRRYLGSGRPTSESTLSPDSRPLSLTRKSARNTNTSASTTTSTRAISSKEIQGPRSVKHNRLQHKLRNYVLDSDPIQIRQQLRQAQDKNLELEQKLQLKSAEMTGIKRRENELRDRERELFGQLRDANDQIKDVEEDRDAFRLRCRTTKRELRTNKISLEEKETQIKLLEARLSESTQLLGANLKNMKHVLGSPISTDAPQPSTSSGITNTTTSPKNDGNIFEDIISNFRDMLENQFQCSICNEVYIFSTIIDCGHTFCEDCILTWMAKKMDCPECRAKINCHIPNKTLDSYIEKFIDNFVPKQFQEQRKALLDERKKKMDERNNGQRNNANHHVHRNNEILVDHNDEDLNLSDTPFGHNGDGIINLAIETDSDSSSDTDSIVSSIEFTHTTSRLFSNQDDLSTDDSLDWQF